MEIDKTPNTDLALNDLQNSVHLIVKSVVQLEKRFALRALKTINGYRKSLVPSILAASIEKNLSESSFVKSKLLTIIENGKTSMEVDKNGEADKVAQVEIEFFYSLLVLIYLLDQKQVQKAITFSKELVEKIQETNKRTLDPIAASIYFYFSLAYERNNSLKDCREILLNAQRLAVLRSDQECQAVLLNLLLRNYLHYNLYEQAEKLVSKSVFPETSGNIQFARFLYYLGRINAVQLNYSEAYQNLLQATRKAPNNEKTAGFQQIVHKLLVVVQLLMGEIPERTIFCQKTLEKPLLPYYHLTQSVRGGDLIKFQETVKSLEAKFKSDKNFALILRLRHNVIKTGIRMISLSYSKISLKDICMKLHLDSEEDTEFIVAKSIRDGVIDAVIDHEHGYMKSKEVIDVYTTTEPQNALHQRIQFCMNLHDESIKAMRFPNNAGRKQKFENSNDLRELAEELSGLVEEDEGEF